MIFITGDTHGLNDLPKLTTYFMSRPDVTKNDYVIILGDVACCWDNGVYDASVKQALHELPCTVLWIDGNHCNFDIIDRLPIEHRFGGTVQMVTDDIIHLMRGQVYTIEGVTFFTFGGGFSIDHMYRVPGRSWWPQEMPNENEYELGMLNLDVCNYTVDYILTHTAPNSVCKQLVTHIIPGEEQLQSYLDYVAKNTMFKDWYFGHWHKDQCVYSKYHAMFQDVIRIN